jgi:hypothetical protein
MKRQELSTWAFVVLGLLFSLTLSGCGGGDGDGGARAPAQVQIEGTVDDGTATSPIANAECRLVDFTDNPVLDADGRALTTRADSRGRYTLNVPPRSEGFVVCTAPDLLTFSLATFVRGARAGEILRGQDVTPATTVVADLIQETNPADKEATKTQLLNAIANETDAELTLLADAATILFNAMREAQISVDLEEAFEDLAVDGEIDLLELASIETAVESAVGDAEQQRGVRIADAFRLEFPVPTANDDTATITEGDSATIDVLANDTDPDGDPLTVVSVTQGSSGTVVINPDNTVTYTPEENFFGTDTFTYTVSDPGGRTDTATVTVTVSAVNNQPVANGATFTTNEDTPLTGTLTATDVDSTAFTFSIVQNGTLGTATITNATTGAFTYTPGANRNGTDSFTFSANDGTADSLPARITIRITPVDDPPVAVDDGPVGVIKNSANNLINVLDNDQEVDGERLVVNAVTQGNQGGTVTIVNNGTRVSYTPQPEFTGTETFTYTISDGQSTDTATVEITVATHLPPVATDDTTNTPEDTAVTINVLTNDTDPDGGVLTVTRVTVAPQNGSTRIQNNQVIYTPNLNFNGNNQFTYEVCDNGVLGDPNVLCDTAEVTVTVTAVNDQPTVTSPGDQTDAEGQAGISVLIIGNDVDQGDTLTFSATGLPANLTLDANTGLITGTISFTAFEDAPNSDGIYEVTITATDQANLASAPVTITWTVTNTNQPPTVTNPGAQANSEGEVVNLQVIASDPDAGDTLTFSATGLPPGLTLASATGLITGTITFEAVLRTDPTFPTRDFAVTITVTDSGTPPNSADVTFTWTVTNTNRAPQIITDLGTRINAVGDTVSLLIQASDSDVGDTLTFSATNLPPTLNINASTGEIGTFIAFNAPLGAHNVTITVSDGTTADNASESFTWRVTPGPVDTGDGDGDGDGDGGGVGGDANDGADRSPLPFALCQFVDLNGNPVLDAQGLPIQDTASNAGRYFLPVPPDQRGFVQCRPTEDVDGDGNLDVNEDVDGDRALDPGEDVDGDGKLDIVDEDTDGNGQLGSLSNLVISTFVSTEGLLAGERLQAQSVTPATTVVRNVVSEVIQGGGNPVATKVSLLQSIADLDVNAPEDVDGDGNLDVAEQDADGDGNLDVDEDADGDGNLDVDEDQDSDGNLDVAEDVDGDGNLDVDEDVNGNGQLDPGEDVDGDGNLDVAEDVDGDGRLDGDEDADGDGNLDIDEDADGDGNLDIDEDIDGDGKLDGAEQDTDNDGTLENFFDVDPTDQELDNKDLASLVLDATSLFNSMLGEARRGSPSGQVYEDVLVNSLFDDGDLTGDLDGTPVEGTVNAASGAGENQTDLAGLQSTDTSRTGTITGSAVDMNGAPLGGVDVVATQSGAEVGRATTDANGIFTLRATASAATSPLTIFDVTLTVDTVTVTPVNVTVVPLTTVENVVLTAQ